MKTWILTFAAVLLAGLIALAIVRIPVRGWRQNESAAIGALRAISDLQNRYALTHQGEGFACELNVLSSLDGSDRVGQILSGTWSGYKFRLTSCTAGSNGAVIKYALLAEPTKPHINGVKTFCTDQSGEIFFEAEGSAEKCLRERNRIADSGER
jgi:hypothetical protein